MKNFRKMLAVAIVALGLTAAAHAMKVRDVYSIRHVDAKGVVTFETGERWIEVPGVMTAEQAKANEAKEAVAAHNADVQRELDADALASIDDYISGDPARAQAAKKRRDSIRSKIKKEP